MKRRQLETFIVVHIVKDARKLRKQSRVDFAIDSLVSYDVDDRSPLCGLIGWICSVLHKKLTQA